MPTFQRFVVGISCGLLCQRGTITAVQQSLAVTGGPVIPSPVSGLELSAQVIYICTQILLNLVQQGRTHFILVRVQRLNKTSERAEEAGVR